MEDYHGTSMSLFQFPSTVNLGEKRCYEKFIKVSLAESRKVRELYSLYMEFEIWDFVKFSTRNRKKIFLQWNSVVLFFCKNSIKIIIKNATYRPVNLF